MAEWVDARKRDIDRRCAQVIGHARLESLPAQVAGSRPDDVSVAEILTENDNGAGDGNKSSPTAQIVQVITKK